MSPDRQRRRVLVRLLAALAAMIVLAQVAEVFEELELPTIDARFRVRGVESPPDGVVIVGIDAVTIDEIGDPWPFTLGTYARVIESLTESGASVIVLDVDPDGVSGSDAERDRFLRALGAAPAVTLGVTRDDGTGSPVVLGGAEALDVDQVRAADARLEADDDGVVRRFDHTLEPDDDSAGSDVGLVSLPVVAYELDSGETLDPSITGDEGATIDLPGPAGTVEQVSFLSVINGRPTEAVEGEIAIVAPTALELRSAVQTALGQDVSSGEVHAAAISTLMDDLPLRTPGTAVQLLLILAACLVPLTAARLTAGRGLVFVIGLTLGWLAVAQAAFSFGWIVPVVAPILGLVGAAIAAVSVNYAFEARSRRRVREVFGRFVPADVVREVVDTESEDDLLRATNREVTVLFSDLRGFTTFSEGRDPHDVVSILNDYLGGVTDVLVDAGAMIDYLGDGVMAVFGAPTDMHDHADRALLAGLEILERTDRFDREHSDRLGTARFRAGVGINSGQVTAGNLGTIRRLKYTVIGDTVNTAARIESMTKDTPYDLLVSDSTVARLHAHPDDLVEHDTVAVRGREQPVRLWSVDRARTGREATPIEN